MWKMCTSPNWLPQDHHRLGNPLGLRGFPNIPGFSYFLFFLTYSTPGPIGKKNPGQLLPAVSLSPLYFSLLGSLSVFHPPLCKLLALSFCLSASSYYPPSPFLLFSHTINVCDFLWPFGKVFKHHPSSNTEHSVDSTRSFLSNVRD